MSLTKTIIDRNSARPTRAGFTLAEFTISVGLIALVVGALYAGMTQCYYRSDVTRQNLRATQIMVEKLEALRLYTWDQIGTPFDPDDPEDWTDPFDAEDPHTTEDEAEPFVLPSSFKAPFTPGSTNTDEIVYHGAITITNASVTEAYGSQLLLCTVTLTWTNGTHVTSRQMQTYFAKYGMQNNISR
jgi:hypothetical protein